VPPRFQLYCRVWFAVLIAAVPSLPQMTGFTGALNGRVLDDAGSLVPGARVVISGASGFSRNTTSAGDGAFTFPDLPPGAYLLAATAPGLATAQPVPVQFDGGGPLSLVRAVELRVKIVAATAQITVQATVNTVTTAAENNASSTTLAGDDLQALSDDPDDLAADLQALAGPSAGPGGGTIFVDGFSDAQIPPKESIREIRINQNPFSPEYDKLGLGRVEIFTKPGTDKYHATLTYNYGAGRWNSRNPYAAQKAPFLLNETENSSSGPLGKRSSFTLDFERQWVDNGSVVNAVTLNDSLNPTPFTAVHLTQQRNLRIAPHIDYQINNNNYLSVRYLLGIARIEGAGIDDFELISRGYHYDNRLNNLQVVFTSLHGSSVNETRFQYLKFGLEDVPTLVAPEISVLGAFNGGGATVGQERDAKRNYEASNYTSILRGPHSWRFGVRVRHQGETNYSQSNFNGTYTFTSIDQYRNTLLGVPGAGPAQFTINAGNPSISVNRFDIGLFAGDDWRIRRNLTLSVGLRYEAQTVVHDLRDWAPRIGIAWAPGAAGSLQPKTVLRGGFGMFYDRLSVANILQAARYNGVVEQQYVVTNPSFYPAIPPSSALGNGNQQAIRELDSNLRAPYVMQSALTLERQLPKSTTLAVTYTNSHSLHVLRSIDINAPVQGTYNPASVSGSTAGGSYPYPGQGPIFLTSSSGLYNQNQMIVNVNSKVSPAVSLFGYYVLNKALSNTDGINTFPGNPYNFSEDYGRASTDIRHRVLLGGTISTRGNFRLNPFISVQSGAPFDITTGTDLYGTTLFTARPGVVTGGTSARPGLIQTPYGLLDPNPAAGEPLLPRNAGKGPMQIQANLRITRTWGFGGERGAKSAAAPADGGSLAGPVLSAPQNTRGLFANPTTPSRYNFTLGLSVRNITNHTNPGPIIGNITSPLFGFSNQMAGGLNGQGFSENATNRRLELQLRLAF